MFSIIQAAGWPVWPLVIASVISLAIIGERAWSLRSSVVTPAGLLQQVVQEYRQNGVDPMAIARLTGGAPLAQGTVYLLLSKKTAHILTALLVSFVVFASVAVILSPIDYSQVEAHRLTGRVFAWQWVRAFSPFVNIYAVVFLIGGAILSAMRYAGNPATRHRMTANVLIALGAMLPGIGGTATRMEAYARSRSLFHEMAMVLGPLLGLEIKTHRIDLDGDAVEGYLVTPAGGGSRSRTAGAARPSPGPRAAGWCSPWSSPRAAWCAWRPAPRPGSAPRRGR